MSVTATLASIPEREANLHTVVECLLPQVDRLAVYLNGYGPVPRWLRRDRVLVHQSEHEEAGDLGDAGKFFAVPPPGYHLVCDDDLVYPPDYAARMIGGVERYGRRAVVTLHGKRFDRMPAGSYYRGWSSNYRCLDEVREDVPVHVPGTGCMAYHTSAVRFAREDFPRPNMADIWVARKCQAEAVPVFCLAHGAGWLRQLPTTSTIFRSFQGRDAYQTEIVNAISWRDHACASPS